MRTKAIKFPEKFDNMKGLVVKALKQKYKVRLLEGPEKEHIHAFQHKFVELWTKEDKPATGGGNDGAAALGGGEGEAAAVGSGDAAEPAGSGGDGSKTGTAAKKSAKPSDAEMWKDANDIWGSGPDPDGVE